MTTTNPTGATPMTMWAGRKPVCTNCGGQVSRPTLIRGQLRGDCVKCGRVDAEWVQR